MFRLIRGVLAASLMLALLEGCGLASSTDGAIVPADVSDVVLTTLSPVSVPVGSPPFTLILNGTGFKTGGTVSWNGTVLGTYSFVSDTQVSILIPASLANKEGKVVVVAMNAGSGSKPSNLLNFVVGPFTQSGCVLFGTYDFFFTGFDGTGPMTTAGAFGVDVNGNVSGEVDYKNRMETRVAQPITGGTCTNGTILNSGTLTITTASGTSTYTFSTQGSQPTDRGRMAESGDTNGVSGTGRFVFVHPATLAGDYVLAVVGANLSGDRMGVVGRFTVATSGTFSNGLGDINNNGTVTSSAVLTGSVTAPDLYSRSTATMVIGGQSFKMAFYNLRPEAAFAIDVDAAGSGAILSGFVDLQLNGGAYGNVDFSSPFVFTTWGVKAGAPALSDTRIGVASAINSGSGTLNLEMDALVGGVASTDQIVPALYSIASSGRGTLSYSLNSIPNNYVLYLYDTNAGFILQGDTAGTVQFGSFVAQDVDTFDNALIDGTASGAGWFNPIASSPNVTAQYNFANGAISATTPAGSLTGSYNVSATGRATGTVNRPVFGSDNVVFYVINATSLAIMGADAVANQGDAISFLNQ